MKKQRWLLAAAVSALALSLSFLGAPAQSASVTVVAMGDISLDPDTHTGSTAYQHQRNVAGLVKTLNPTKVITLGDLQYDTGLLDDYTCVAGGCTQDDGHAAYDDNEGYGTDSYGDFIGKTFEIPGNHDWDTANAQGLRDYFSRTGTGAIYYKKTVGDWRIYMLDSDACDTGDANTDCDAGDAMYDWLAADLVSNPVSNDTCVAAAWHHPVFANTPEHGMVADTKEMDGVYELLDREAGADLILWGHEHHYERYPRQTQAAGTRNGAPWSFIVGTGGAGTYDFDIDANGTTGVWDFNSQFRYEDNGYLKLVLDPTSFTYTFVDENGTAQDGPTTSNCTNDPDP